MQYNSLESLLEIQSSSKDLNPSYAPNPNAIHFLEAPCGSGKTFAFIQEVLKKQSFQKTLYLAPTTKLADEVSNALKKNLCLHKKVHSSSSGEGTVERRIINAVNEINSIGSGTLLITHTAFLMLPKSVREVMKDWRVVADEEFAIEKFTALNVPRNHWRLTEYLVLGEQVIDDFYRIYLKDEHESLQFAKSYEGVHDHFDEPLYPIIRNLLDGYKGYTDIKQWNKVIIDNIIDEDEASEFQPNKKVSKNQISFHFVLGAEKFKGFSKFTMMAAGFKSLLTYRIFEKSENVTWIADEELGENLRYTEHENGERLNIFQFSSKEPSKNILYATDDNGERMIQKYVRWIEKQNQGKPILFFNNNDVLVHKCKSIPDNVQINNKNIVEIFVPYNWIQIPVKSHGLNSFSHIHNVAILGAFNRCPSHARFLTGIHGFTIQELNRCTAHEVYQQNLNRSSLRDLEAKDAVNVYTMGEEVLESLGMLFVDTTFHYADDRESEKVVALTKTEQKSKERLNILYEQELLDNSHDYFRRIDAIEESKATDSVLKVVEENARNILSKNVSLPSILDVKRQNLTEQNQALTEIKNRIWIYNNLSHSATNVSKGLETDEIIAFFKKHQTNKITRNKEDNKLFGATFFEDGDLDEPTPRRKEFAREVSPMIVLDVDDGDMTPKDLEDFLRAEKIPSFIYSSNGHQDERGLDKYRAVLFASKHMTVETFNITMKWVLNRITEVTGFYHVPHGKKTEDYRKQYPNRKISGIDLSKTNVSSIFYLPSTPKGREDKVFFTKILCTKRELERGKGKPIDVDLILSEHVDIVEKQQKKPCTVRERQKDVTTNKNHDSLHDRKKSAFIEDKLKELEPGNRSYLSTVIVGYIKRLKDDNLREQIFNRLINDYGLDKNAIKSCTNYYYRS